MGKESTEFIMGGHPTSNSWVERSQRLATLTKGSHVSETRIQERNRQPSPLTATHNGESVREVGSQL